MIKITELQIPVLLITTSNIKLLEEFPSCAVCKKRLARDKTVVVYRERDVVRAVVHNHKKHSPDGRSCIAQFKTRLINQYTDSLTREQICILLGISDKSYWRLIQNGK